MMLRFEELSFHPRADYCGRVRCEPGWNLSPTWAQGLIDYDLWFVWKGRGTMTTSAGEHALAPGVCLWMRPGHRYEAEQDPELRLGVNYIHFSARKRQVPNGKDELKWGGENLPISAFKPPFEVVVTRQIEFVDMLMRRIILLAGEPQAEAANDALLTALLAELYREYENGPTAIGAAISGTELHHYEVAMRSAARIRESPAEVLGVAQLASEAGYSADHFSRIFLSVTGLRPQDYLIKARIDRARQLLAESDLTIGEVATRVGFSDIFYFSRLFRQRTGQPPSAFRRSLCTNRTQKHEGGR